MLIGLDCVPPGLAFERYREHMPNLSRLMQMGSFAHLRSTFPPITVPAWTSMVSGRDPGELGVYGFRTRPRGQYALSANAALTVRTKRVWDLLAERGGRSSVLFVPPSYPPLQVSGESVSCFLTPDAEHPHTFPARLAGELAARFGAYMPDLAHVRTADPVNLYGELERMTSQHFAMAGYLWETRVPDFMMLVEIGPDRFHHVYWEYLDPAHPRYVPGNPYEQLGPRYYGLLDRELGALISRAGPETAVIVASDHGARALRGGFCINEWLRREGWLVLRREPSPAGPLTPELVDWSRTRAWAAGGYYARVFLNVSGREPEGIVPPTQREDARRALRECLLAVRGPDGRAWDNRVETPETLYREVRGEAPDLLAIFDDLGVRALSTLGTGALFSEGAGRGADGCNHDWDGILVMAGPGVQARGDLGRCDIYDVGASALALLGIDKPTDWLGQDRTRAP